MARDGDVVVVEEQLDVDLVCRSEPRSLGIVPLHLRVAPPRTA
jgi:hypothetical protein